MKLFITNLIILITTTLFSNFCFAEDVVTVYKGEVVPFDGTLLSVESAARLTVELESFPERLELVKRNSEIRCNLVVENLLMQEQVRNETARKVLQSNLQASELTRKLLQDKIDSTSSISPYYYFGGGIVGGILLSSLAVLFVSNL